MNEKQSFKIWHEPFAHENVKHWQAASSIQSWQRAGEPEASLVEIMNIKSCITDAGWIYSFPLAEVGNVVGTNRWNIVYHCRPNHSLMATINCRPKPALHTRLQLKPANIGQGLASNPRFIHHYSLFPISYRPTLYIDL